MTVGRGGEESVEQRAGSAALASATIPTTTGWFMPICSGSRSIWINGSGPAAAASR